MTRYTNLGRKRTYVAAEFNYRDSWAEASTSTITDAGPGNTHPEVRCSEGSSPSRRKKRRKDDGTNLASEHYDKETLGAAEGGEGINGPVEAGGAGVSGMQVQGNQTHREIRRKNSNRKRIKGKLYLHSLLHI